MSDPKNSRGYRNKNSGNIDWNANNKWQGQVGRETTGSPPRFAVFESHEFGIRALAVLLITYQDRYDLRTIAGLINRWCPPKDAHAGNQRTDLYIKHVSDLTGFSSDERLDLHTYDHIMPIVKAIITHELGGNPYTQSVIDDGLRRAGIIKPITTLTEAGCGSYSGAVSNCGIFRPAVCGYCHCGCSHGSRRSVDSSKTQR
jgi:hypothetical protein